MFDTAIGLETGTGRRLGHARLQEHFASVGLQPYLPQLGATRKKWDAGRKKEVEVFALSSYNLGVQFDPETESLNWPQEAIDACLAFPHPMIGYFGKYHYSQQPRAFGFAGIPQDELSFAELGSYMKKVLSCLRGYKIANPWFMVDEPPHETGERYTEEVGERVYKVVTVAATVGWKVGICCPSPFHLAYWADRIQMPVRWILNAKHDPDLWRKGLKAAERNQRSPEIWLYNQVSGFDGLGARLLRMGATGYLHWSAESSLAPLAVVGEQDFMPTPGLGTLLNELRATDSLSLETLHARLTAVERTVFG